MKYVHTYCFVDVYIDMNVAARHFYCVVTAKTMEAGEEDEGNEGKRRRDQDGRRGG